MRTSGEWPKDFVPSRAATMESVEYIIARLNGTIADDILDHLEGIRRYVANSSRILMTDNDGNPLTNVRVSTDCSNCGVSDTDCLHGIRGGGDACCARCWITDTHYKDRNLNV